MKSTTSSAKSTHRTIK